MTVHPFPELEEDTDESKEWYYVPDVKTYNPYKNLEVEA